MPYVTEEIYSMLPLKEAESIMISTYPKYNKEEIYEDEETKLDKIIEDITAIRNLKVTNNITKEALVILKTDSDIRDVYIKQLKINIENIINDVPEGKEEYNYKSNYIDITFYAEGEQIDKDKIKEEISKLEESIQKREKLLANENYTSRAPSHVVEQDRVKLKEEQEKLDNLKKMM